MLFRKSYFFILFIFNLSLVSFHFLKNLNFSGTTKYMKDYWFLLNQFEVREIFSKSMSSYNLRICS
ncbi:hypothetical protein LEP1GSC082_4083 [Leptospira kirschneri str. H2]|nr:hypothetical protein LEP1GSC082_4083 [Leptospira kirschneri str. H2]